MAREHIVVDGSNIATEGRNAPSLAQLEEAVGELHREHPEAEVTVIVDATFSHRIDQEELARFEEAVLKGEYVHPPAGAIGRGDAFLLRIAEKVDATVLSNDSFQEFHGEHPWLFERGRLLGGTPVPGVGWIFSPRTPVRGPKSRKALASTSKKSDDKEKRKLSKAIEAATKEAVEPQSRKAKETGSGRGSSRKQGAVVATAAAVNDPLTFVSFIAEHPLGTEVSGEVESYTSHGAVVMVDSTQCYLPLANMAAPAPRSAREVVKKGERRNFVVTALDPQRRGVEIALPGVAPVSGRPSAETIEAELRLVRKKQGPAKRKPPEKKKAPVKKAAQKAPAPAEDAPAPPGGKTAQKSAKATKQKAPSPPGKTSGVSSRPESLEPVAKETTAKKPPARKKATDNKTAQPDRPEQTPAKKASTKKASSKKAAAKRTSGERSPSKRAPSKSAAPAKKAAKKASVPDEPVGPRRSPRSARSS